MIKAAIRVETDRRKDNVELAHQEGIEPPESSTWGATPPLPDAVTQAAEEMRHGQQRAAMTILETDPGDELAAALASLSRTLQGRSG
jgi:hypothetical protein